MQRLCLFALLFIFLSCDEELTVNSLTGEWKLTHYYNLNTGALVTEPEGLDSSVVLIFTDDGKAGTIEGHTVTNAVFGSYELGPHRTVKILSFGGTKVGEPQWGARVWTGLNTATSYKNAQQTMSIFFNEDNEVFLFTRK